MHVVAQDGTRTAVAAPAVQQQFVDLQREEAGWTLREWWAKGVRPAMEARGNSKATLANYETYLKRWDAFSNLRCRTPKVSEISPLTLEEFRTYIITQENVSRNAADKHLSAISYLLKRAEDAWILPRTARLPSLTAKPRGLKFTFSAAEMNALHAAAEGCVWPACWADRRELRPEVRTAFWRAFLIGGWNYGFRTQEWWSYERSANAITWSGVEFGALTAIEGRDVSNASGWLAWTQDKTGHRVIVPMNATVRRHFVRLAELVAQGRQRPDRRIWDFPLSNGSRKSGQKLTPASGFYAAWWDLVARAGITPSLDASGSPATHRPSQFRKTARTLHGDKIGNAADWITGHRSGKGVGELIYYNAVGKVIESVHAIEQPDSFLAPN